MAQPMAISGEESTETWLPIIEYSIKSGVSLSTIRRRIKSNSIPYRLENGKYLILYQEGQEVHEAPENGVATTPSVSRPAQNVFSGPVSAQRSFVRNYSNVTVLRPTTAPKAPVTEPKNPDSFNMTGTPAPKREDPAAVRMLSDAYEHALREKEERIILLEKHVRDQETRLEELKLLVGLLEEKYEVRY